MKAIIFDYDGVIADSFPMRHEIFQQICPLLGKTCPSTQQGLKAVWGDNAAETLKRMGCAPEEVTRGLEIFTQELERKTPPLFPHIVEVIEQLSREYTLFVLTANKESRIRQQLEEAGIAKYFAAIIGNESLFTADYQAKKDAKIIALLKQIGAEPRSVLFIADRDIDRRDALAAGIPDTHIILTDYGYGHTKKQPWPVERAEDLLTAVESIAHR